MRRHQHAEAWARGAVHFALCALVLALWPAAGSAQHNPAPHGQLFYSRLTDGTWQIWTLDLLSQEQMQLTSDEGDKRHPSWDHAGSIAYCTSNQRCFRTGLNGQGRGLLLGDLWPMKDVAWSPDGRRLAFTRFRTDLIDSANLWLADAGGAERRMITHEPGIQQHPAWSPDGQWIAYSAGQGYGTYEIYVVRADGTERRRSTQNQAHEFGPAWSPDGHQIAFSSDVSGDYEIWVLDADGSNLRQLTQNPGLDTDPAWSPDGQAIAFVTNRSGTLQIWLMNPDGTDPRPLVQQAGQPVCDPTWK